MAKMKLSDITGGGFASQNARERSERKKETRADLQKRVKRYETALGEILNDRKNVSQAVLVSRLQGIPYNDVLEMVVEAMEGVAKKALEG